MKWYDRIAKSYDFFTSRIYKKARKTLVENLGIKKGNRVLIIACGTGQSFDLIENKIGKEGEIIAVDYSEGMLSQAKKRILKNKWKNIKLIHKDIRDINEGFLKKESIRSNFDVIIGELAFSVIPDWKNVMDTSISMLKKGGKIGLLDWYRQKNDLITKIVDYLAEAKTTRKTLNYAEKIFENVEIKGKYFLKNIYIAVAVK